MLNKLLSIAVLDDLAKMSEDVFMFKKLTEDSRELKWIPKRQWSSEQIVHVSLTPELLDYVLETDFHAKVLRQIIKLVSKNETERATDFLIRHLETSDGEVKILAANALKNRSLLDCQKLKIEKFISKNITKTQKDYVYVIMDLLSNSSVSIEARENVWSKFKKQSFLNQTILVHNSDLFLKETSLTDFLEKMTLSRHPEIRETAVRKLVSLDGWDVQNSDTARRLKNDDDVFVSAIATGVPLDSHVINCRLTEDIVKGIIYCSAIGDAIGAPIEFLSREKIIEKYKTPVDTFDFYRDDLELRTDPGSISDDTDMGLRILEASLDSGWIDPSQIGVHFSSVIGDIDSGDMPNIGYSANTSAGLRKIGRGANWRLVGRPLTKGCGAAMRAFAIPILCDEPFDDVVTKDVSRITHNSLETLDSSLVIVKVIRWLSKLDRDSFDNESFLTVLRGISLRSEEMKKGLSNFYEALDMDLDDGLAKIGTGGNAVEAVPAALLCFFKYPTDFKSLLRSAINVTGDSDSIACIAGGLFGAYNGYDSIDKHYIDNLKNKARIESIINRLTING
ncbi:ADP-ribosylglycohydrolase family protein [bacterium]|jgi:ADP-ribosylglycohydrolase|nr:ADP-ribosylglycohydrolase family protein [bacterium]